MSFELTADVAIVGYGPTGQSLSLLLGRWGTASSSLTAGPIYIRFRALFTLTMKSRAFFRPLA